MDVRATDSGLLTVFKPKGITSQQLMTQLKRQLGFKDIGHAGTLDQFAAGLMIVGIGEGTKLLRFFFDADQTSKLYYKKYICKFIFGHTTETLDPTTLTAIQLSEFASIKTGIDLNDINTAIETHFLNAPYEQSPPVYSAMKFQGQRLSDLVRHHDTTNQVAAIAYDKRRLVDIQKMSVLDWADPQITLEIECSKGTYIRSMARDLAAILQTTAFCSELFRSEVGSFSFQGNYHCSERTVLAALAIDKFYSFETLFFSENPFLDVIYHPQAERLRHGIIPHTMRDDFMLDVTNNGLALGSAKNYLVCNTNRQPISLINIARDSGGTVSISILRGINL